jgi:hypothetical protein
MNLFFSLFRSTVKFCLCASLLCLSTAHADDAKPDLATQNAIADQYIQALKAMNEKRHADAKLLLEKLIASEPQHAGALLDLAIMQCNLGNKVEAERLFAALINRFAPPPAILEIIELHKKTGCTIKAPEIAVSFMVEKGYDTNANQGARNSIFTIDNFGSPINLQLLPDYLPKPDHYQSISLDLSEEPSIDGTAFFLQLRGRQYNNLSKLNSAGIAAGIEKQLAINNWQVNPSININALSMANALYQKQVTSRIRFTAPASQDSLMKYSVALAVSRLLYPTIKNFDGTTFELRATASKQTQNYLLNVSIATMQDQGNEQRLGGNRYGWGLSGFMRYVIPAQIFDKPIFLEMGWQHLDWQSKKIYLSGLIDTKKHQSNSMIRMALGIPISEYSTIQLEYRRVLNRENISFLSFESRQIQLSWQYQR